MEGGTYDKTKSLLKCFCGCSEMPVEEVQKIYKYTCQQTLINEKATDLLKNYLKLQRISEEKLQSEKYMDVYFKCKDLLSSEPMITLDERDELDELGLLYHLTRELTEIIKTGDREAINRGLLRIQGEMREHLSEDSHYKDYKQAILDKLKRAGIL